MQSLASLQNSELGRKAASTPNPPFAPSDIAGLVVWLKANALVLTNGAAVASWTDSSGTGNTVVQATGGNQPTYIASGINSLPVVRFDGVNDSLQKVTPVGLPTGANPWTLFIVMQASDKTAGRTIFNMGTSGTDLSIEMIFRAGGNLYMDRYGNNDEESFGNLSLNTPYLLALTYDGVNEINYVNSTTALNTFAATPNLTTSTLDIGALVSDSIFHQGDIAEVILYNSALNSTDRQSVQSYLNTKYVIY